MPKIELQEKSFFEMLGVRPSPEEFAELLSVAKAELDDWNEQENSLKIELNDTNRPDLWSGPGLVRQLKAFREGITWLFAFGLVGLGMQITVSSMKQAGGAPAVIGGVVGLTKAVLSLVVVMMLISETV